MENTKFIVKVDRGGSVAPVYVLRIEPSPILTTSNRKLALVMGKFTAEDAVQSLQNSRCSPELVSVSEFGTAPKSRTTKTTANPRVLQG